MKFIYKLQDFLNNIHPRIFPISGLFPDNDLKRFNKTDHAAAAGELATSYVVQTVMNMKKYLFTDKNNRVIRSVL